EHGWAFEGQPGSGFTLLSNKKDKYDGAQIILRKELKRGYPILVSYTRSKAISNRIVDFSIDSFLEGNQTSGPLPWDAPNQLGGWGWYPLLGKLKKFDFEWSTLWHSGYPFFVVDQFGQIVPTPGQTGRRRKMDSR